MKPYQHLATLYDSMNMDQFAVNMVNYTFRILQKLKHRPKSVLELCCGTGTAATMFAEHSLEVVGVDGSPFMIKEARKKAKTKKLNIKFTNQVLPDLAVKEKGGRKIKKFDLVTSYFDSLNYLLTEDDLKKCFRRVNEHLVPGGLFIFDMNTYYAFKTIWIKSTNAGFRDDLGWVWKAQLDNAARQVTLTAVFFAKKGRYYERFEEKHTEKAYPNGEIKRFLKAAGFEILGFYKAFRFRKPDTKTNRIAVVARKKA